MSPRPKNARHHAYVAVKERILTLQYAPSQRLDEVGIAAEIGVSRTPIREVFHQLAADGLVVIAPGGGYLVADMNLQRFYELVEAQHVLVRAVAHLLVAHCGSQALSELHERARAVDTAVAALDPAAISHANAQLHIAEAAATGNSYLGSLGTTVHTHLQRFAYLSFGGMQAVGAPFSDELTDHYQRVHTDHWDFLAAIKRRDAPAAEAIAVRHAELFHGRIRDFLQGHAARTIDFSTLPSLREAGRN